MPRKQTETPAAAPTQKLAPSAPESILARFKDFPAVAVLERRFSNPDDPGSLPILLNDEAPDACVNSEHQNRMRPGATKCHLCQKPTRKWFLYWVNTGNEGRWAVIKTRGFVAVEVKELQDSQDVAALVKQQEESGAVLVRRGDRGQEILCKTPLEARNFIRQQAKAQRDAKMRDPKARRDERAELAGQALGDRAGQSIYDGAIREEFMREERTSLGDEAAAGD